jgi:hypothetical protein
MVVRQIRAEVCKLLHPALFGTVLWCAIVAAYMQLHNAEPAPPVGVPAPSGPGPLDVAGAVQIAALQTTSTLGFLVASVAAAVGTASEADAGLLPWLRTFEPRAGRLVLVKAVAGALVLLASLVTTAVVVYVGAACANLVGVRMPPDGPTAWASTAGTLVAALPVIAFASVVTIAIAVVVRAPTAVAIVGVCVFALPLLALRISAVTYGTPTRWIIEVMQYDASGLGRDYLAGDAADASMRWTSGALVLGATLALTVLAAAAVRRDA